MFLSVSRNVWNFIFSITVSSQRSPDLTHGHLGNLLNSDSQAPPWRFCSETPDLYFHHTSQVTLVSSGIWKLLLPEALSSMGPEDKHVHRALWSTAVSICGELAQFLALDYPTKLSPGRF